MMNSFIYQNLPVRVVFGAGKLASLGEEIERLEASRALILSTPEQEGMAEAVARQLGTRAGGVFARAVMHVPIETAHEARRVAADRDSDCCVAIGGGSTIGLAKAIALTSGLPIVAIPTTFAGSEVTPIYGLTEGGAKKTGRDARVMPKTVIYDPELLRTLPPRLVGPSGMNAIAHCAEALYAADANPIISLMAEEGVRALSSSLPNIQRRPQDLDARAEALYGAWLAGTCLGTVQMALHHKLCHTLGGSFDLPHSETHTVVLPHAMKYNSEAAPPAMAALGRALGCAAEDVPGALFDLAKNLVAPTSLAEIGMPGERMEEAADIALRNPYSNPRPVEREPLLQLLRDAQDGRRP